MDAEETTVWQDHIKTKLSVFNNIGTENNSWKLELQNYKANWILVRAEMLVFQTMPEPDWGLNCVTSTVSYLGPQIVQSTKPSTCRNKTKY